MEKENIGIITSVPSEGKMFSQMFKPAVETLYGNLALKEGTIAGRRVYFGTSGIGKTNAAHAVTVLVERFSPSCILNFGIGGSYFSSGLRVGDIAVAEKEIYADEGVLLKDGFHSFEITGIPILKVRGRKYFNEFPADKRLGRQALNAACAIARSKPGVFLTVSACTGTRKRAEELEEKFGPICENMEGAAVAHICRIYGIPFVEIRGISNVVEDRDIKKWDIKLAADNCQKAVLRFLESVCITSMR